jgi:hypothetical protein
MQMPKLLIVLQICLRRCWVVAETRYDCPFWTILATLLAQEFPSLKSAVQEIPYFSVNKRFVTGFTKPHNWTMPWTSCTLSPLPPYFCYTCFNRIFRSEFFMHLSIWFLLVESIQQSNATTNRTLRLLLLLSSSSSSSSICKSRWCFSLVGMSCSVKH